MHIEYQKSSMHEEVAHCFSHWHLLKIQHMYALHHDPNLVT